MRSNTLTRVSNNPGAVHKACRIETTEERGAWPLNPPLRGDLLVTLHFMIPAKSM